MLGLNELKQTMVYQDASEEGRLEGELVVVIRQLTRRVGAIEPQLRKRCVSVVIAPSTTIHYPA